MSKGGTKTSELFWNGWAAWRRQLGTDGDGNSSDNYSKGVGVAG